METLEMEELRTAIAVIQESGKHQEQSAREVKEGIHALNSQVAQMREELRGFCVWQESQVHSLTQLENRMTSTENWRHETVSPKLETMIADIADLKRYDEAQKKAEDVRIANNRWLLAFAFVVLSGTIALLTFVGSHLAYKP